MPGLGSIPIIGNLFRVRNTQKTKTNLMVFIRPRVVRTAEQAAIETNAKYNYLRNMQLEKKGGKVQLMPGENRPTLPPLVGPTATADRAAGFAARRRPPAPPPPDSRGNRREPRRVTGSGR